MTRTRRKTKKKSSSLLLFVWFIAIALVTIVLLEYIEFKKGKKPFIFTKIIPLESAAGKIQHFNKEFIALLNKNKISYDYFPDEEKKYHFKLDIHQSRFDGFITEMQTITTQLKGKLELSEIQGFPGKSIMLYKIKFDKDVSHLVLITKLRSSAKAKKPVEKPARKPRRKTVKRSGRKPRIAFIIDDIGAYDIGALELKQLDIPITASVLPGSHRARQTVQWLREYRLKTMIHLPMQPTNSNGKRYNPGKVITINSTDSEIRSLIRRAKQIVPSARGLNNHEGSLVTANRAVMTRVLKIIKEEDLFFVDSRTIGRTVAYDIARELHIKTAHKDVFLDHTQSYSHSMAQIKKLVDTALQKGKAIAIGHPFASTLRAIHDSKRYIRAKGVEIVDVNELLE